MAPGEPVTDAALTVRLRPDTRCITCSRSPEGAPKLATRRGRDDYDLPPGP